MLARFFFAALLLSPPTIALSMSAGVLAASKVELKYFNARGAAETVRVLLAIGGEDYHDARYEITPGTMSSPAFEAAKDSGELKVNLNRAPVLMVDGVAIGQSKAMERFLAKRYGLMGSSPTEEALIDCMVEHCRDVGDASTRKGFSPFARGKTDEEKKVLRDEWFSTDFPTWLEKINVAVQETSKTPGFAVESSLSLADVKIWTLLKECQDSDKEDTVKAALNCVALNAIASAVASNPKVSHWIENRPVTMF